MGEFNAWEAVGGSARLTDGRADRLAQAIERKATDDAFGHPSRSVDDHGVGKPARLVAEAARQFGAPGAGHQKRIGNRTIAGKAGDALRRIDDDLVPMQAGSQP